MTTLQPNGMQPPKHRYLLPMLGALACAAILLRIFDPATSGFFPPCPVRYLTGWYCPGCGSLRALHALLHGQFGTAWAMNPMSMILLPFVLYGLASHALREIRGRGLPQVFIPSTWIRAYGLAVVVYGIARNIPAHPFNLLAPGGMLRF